MRLVTTTLLLCGLVWAGGADQAAAQLKAGNAAKAAELARALVKKDGGNADAWLVLADALIAQGKAADAWGVLEEAIDKNDKDARLSIRLGDVFVKLAEAEQAANGDGTTIINYYRDAERNYQDAAQKDPKSADAVYGEAYVNFCLGPDTKEQASTLLSQALALDKDHAKSHALRAYMLYLDGNQLAQEGKRADADPKFQAAQAEYELALKDGGDTVDYVRYGHTFYAQGKWDEAKKAYLAGLKAHPLDDLPIRSGLYHLANREANPKSWSNLQPYLEEAVKLAPKAAPAWYYLGYCHSAAQRWPEAMAAYKKAMDLAPTNATYVYNVGWAYENLGKQDEALDHYRKALQLAPDYGDAAARFEKIILVNAGNIAVAEKLFEELIKLAPHTGYVHNDYALLLRDWAEGTRTHKQQDPPPDVKRRLKRSGEVYEMAAAIEVDDPQYQSDCGLLFEFYPCNFDAAKAKMYFVRSLDKSDYAYRDAFDGLDRLCRKTGDWKTLEYYADLVVDSMERGNQAIAPAGGGAPQALPNETPGLKARAEAALKVARENLKKEG